MRWSRTLLIRNDLRLLDARFEQLQHAPFFREGLYEYVTQLRRVIAAVLDKEGVIAPELARSFTNQVWGAYRYLSGSVSREIPYEIVYGLDLALGDWIAAPPNYIVTTAFLSELSYHFEGVPPQFYRLAESELGITFEHRVVQVALPQLYKHQPLNNAVLYHELGHFVDQQFGVSRMMALQDSGGGQITHSQLSHAAEYFADLFAATYVGSAVCTMLEAMAPNASASATHPATADRRAVVDAFLGGRAHQIVALANAALISLNLTPLSIRFTEPDVRGSFDAVRSYRLASKREVHGLLLAAQRYLSLRLADLSGAWGNVSEGEATRMINDLTEKSTRNWMIREKWTNAGSAEE